MNLTSDGKVFDLRNIPSNFIRPDQDISSAELQKENKANTNYSTPVLIALMIAGVVVNLIAALMNTPSFTAPLNLVILSAISITLIYNELKKSNSQSTRVVLIAFLLTSFVLNILHLASVFSGGHFPGGIGGLQLLSFVVTGGLLVFISQNNQKCKFLGR